MSDFYQPAIMPASLTVILAALSRDDAERVATAFQYAAAAHAGQLRDEGTPFIDHPVRVAGILWSELGQRDPDMLVAALNHDVIEDTDLPAHVVAEFLGPRAGPFVLDLTKQRVPEHLKAERDARYLDHIASAGEQTRLLKLADRIDNLRSVISCGDHDKMRRYLVVSRDVFLPLAERTDITAARLVAEACDAIDEFLESAEIATRGRG